jgi:hypothetical protein
MDHIKIIKRAYQITKVYRALWIFGILLALTAGGGGGGSGNPWIRFDSGRNGGFPFFEGDRLPWSWEEVYAVLIPVGIALLCLGLLLAVGLTIVRYVSETAVVRMVDQFENTEEKVSFREGFRMGWSRPAWRMFLIDLLVGVCTVLAVILLGLIAAAPLLLWLTRSDTFGILGTAVTVGLAVLFIFLGILAAIAVSVLIQFIRRACVLEDLGVFESIRRGLALVRKRLGDVAVMAVILFGIGLGWLIVMIPVYVLLALAGVLVGGLPGLGAGLLADLVTEGAWPWIVGLGVGLPIFLLVFSLPALFLNGLLRTFVSSSWTLMYRELLTTENGGAGVDPSLQSESLA